jgi:hypothetical protein
MPSLKLVDRSGNALTTMSSDAFEAVLFDTGVKEKQVRGQERIMEEGDPGSKKRRRTTTQLNENPSSKNSQPVEKKMTDAEGLTITKSTGESPRTEKKNSACPPTKKGQSPRTQERKNSPRQNTQPTPRGNKRRRSGSKQ